MRHQKCAPNSSTKTPIGWANWSVLELLECSEVGNILTGASVANGLAMEIGTDAVQEALAAGLIAGSQSAAAAGRFWSLRK